MNENYEMNKEKIKKRDRDYYEMNKEKIKKRSREYYEKNKSIKRCRSCNKLLRTAVSRKEGICIACTNILHESSKANRHLTGNENINEDDF